MEIADREMVHTRVLVDAPFRSGFAYTDAMHVAPWLARGRFGEPAASGEGRDRGDRRVVRDVVSHSSLEPVEDLARERRQIGGRGG
ncbi:MAG TPA: hypothetical protein VM925_24330 [Labilithrix sp.]|nr:hypothetical protein [Labilithrix sp.]